MPRPPAPVAQPPAGAPPTQGGALGKLKGKNGAIYAAGATVAVVALLALVRGKSSSSSSTPDATTIQPTGSYDSGPYDMWDQWQQEYEGLQGQINGLQNGQSTTPPTPTPVPVPKPPTPTPAPTPKPSPIKPPIPVRPTPTHPVKAPAPKPQTVTVKHGDTLSGIAAKYHISMTTLKKLNPVYWTNAKYHNGNSIWSGDKVRVK